MLIISGITTVLVGEVFLKKAHALLIVARCSKLEEPKLPSISFIAITSGLFFSEL